MSEDKRCNNCKYSNAAARSLTCVKRWDQFAEDHEDDGTFSVSHLDSCPDWEEGKAKLNIMKSPF